MLKYPIVHLLQKYPIRNKMIVVPGRIEEFRRDYDIVFDAVDKLPASKGRMLLKGNGKFGKVGADSKVTIDDFYFLRDLVEQEKLRTVIDRVYPLEHLVEANRYVEKGHKKGHVVITVDHEK